MMHFLQFFFFGLTGAQMINYCTHYYPQMGKWSHLLETTDYIKGEV